MQHESEIVLKTELGFVFSFLIFVRILKCGKSKGIQDGHMLGSEVGAVWARSANLFRWCPNVPKPVIVVLSVWANSGTFSPIFLGHLWRHLSTYLTQALLITLLSTDI